MSAVGQIKQRIAQFSELEKQLMTAGPAKAKVIIQEQTKIEEFYMADVMELLETMENVIYQLSSLEPLLEMPDKGYVRNNFNRVISTLKEGF